MLQTAFEDSGKDGVSQSFVFAGYIGDVDALMDLSHDWADLLRKEPKLDYIKGYEAFGLHTEFFGWSEKERDERLLEFVPLIAKYSNKGLAFAIDNVPFEMIKDLPDDEGTRFHDPAEFAYNASFVYLLQALPDFNETCIDLVCDRDLVTRRQANRAYERIFSQSPDLAQRLFRKEPHWEDDQQFLPLQAADLLAYCVRATRDPSDKRHESALRSPVLSALRAIPTVLAYIDEEQIEYLRDRVIKRIPRRPIFKSAQW